MANTKSAIKKIRVDARRHEQNNETRKSFKLSVKQARKDLGNKESVSGAFKQLDKAAKARVIHPNKASRLKSRLAKAANKVSK